MINDSAKSQKVIEDINFRAHSRPLIRLRLMTDHQTEHPPNPNTVVASNNPEQQPSTIEGQRPSSDEKRKKKKKGSKQVLVTLSDSPLLQEHKVSKFIFLIRFLE